MRRLVSAQIIYLHAQHVTDNACRAQMLAKDWDDIPTYMGTGVSRAVMSNRVSYFGK